jgi:Serine incorporator (Serinc)
MNCKYICSSSYVTSHSEELSCVPHAKHVQFECAAIVGVYATDPKNGKAALWLTASGQWACLLLYLWTLAAPRLMPDRDFS